MGSELQAVHYILLNLNKVLSRDNSSCKEGCKEASCWNWSYNGVCLAFCSVCVCCPLPSVLHQELCARVHAVSQIQLCSELDPVRSPASLHGTAMERARAPYVSHFPQRLRS